MARSVHDSKKIRFGLGSGNNLGKTKTTIETIAKFQERFKKPLVTSEKFHEYKKMTDAQQRHLKGINGWFMRAAVAKGENRNRNSILDCQILTFDFDYATPEFLAEIQAEKVLPGVKLDVHSTRSSTPEKPRLRMIVYLAGKLDREMYPAVSRIVAQLADPNMEYVDKVSFRTAQMMYMPTVSKDMEKHYVFYSQEGDLLDHEEVLESWEMMNGPASDIGNLPKTPDEDELRETAEKAEDPLEKKGPVGDFCRAYTITELVLGKDGEKGILADEYEVVEEAQGAITRMTYTQGTTSNGAVVYDDLFVYSHHGSDPCCDMLVNAYDLVRIHKFGDEDKNADKDTPISKLPSMKKMTEWLKGDSHYRIAQAESRYNVEDMLEDDDVEYEGKDEDEDDDLDAEDLLGMPLDAATGVTKGFRPPIGRKYADKPPKNWIAKELELTDDGKIKNTMHNVGHILLNDPRLWRKICFNQFSNQIVLMEDIKSKTRLIPTIPCTDKVNGERWSDDIEIAIRAVLDGPTTKGIGYGLPTGKEMIADAVRLASMNNAFHPIRDYYQFLQKNWTRKEGCIDEVFVKYFGAEDTVYNRAVARQTMIAAVARVMEPGCKYDYVVIFEGQQGIGKSTAIKRLFGEEYFGELDGNLNNRQYTAEQMQGKHAMEMPEMSSMHKSDANDAKAFVTRQHDDVRMVYKRHLSNLPRQCVIFGTTNDTKYLRDATGGRRYLPVILTDVESIDVLGLMAVKDDLWLDAYEAYIEMRTATPYGDLPLYLKGEAAETALVLQERARVKEPWENWLEAVVDWMDEHVKLQSLISDYEFPGHDKLDNDFKGVPLDTEVQRVSFTQKHVFDEAFGFHQKVPTGAQPQQMWEKVLNHLSERGWGGGKARKIGGKVGKWVVRPDVTKDEKWRGFRIYDPAQAPGIACSTVSDDDDDGDSLL